MEEITNEVIYSELQEVKAMEPITASSSKALNERRRLSAGVLMMFRI